MKLWRTFLAVTRGLGLTLRFFLAGTGVACVYILGFPYPVLINIGHGLLLVLFLSALVDALLLFNMNRTIRGERSVPKLFSLGDPNTVRLNLTNGFPIPLEVEVYDELPKQFQEREFKMAFRMSPGEERTLNYDVTPKKRGEFLFGNINVIAHTMLGLVSRRHIVGMPQMVPTYPSVIQMKKYELLAFAKTATMEGIKKVRRLGHSYEFEQIKTYVQGDDVRSINWKATSRRSQLMVNQYEDERSQQVYTIIDKSRSMYMPFNGLSLLDYAINTSLVISNIALKKHDKVGLISYSNRIGSTVKAEKSQLQLKKILAALYNEKEQNLEANYDLLYRATKNVIKSRSLVFVYLNFESVYAMERALPVLQKINKQHLLVCMVFENTELLSFTRKSAEFIQDIYTQTIAEKLIHEKKHMVSKMRKYGIQTILTRPEDLSINTVNKYLELKKTGQI